jgi:hypothetical protein
MEGMNSSMIYLIHGKNFCKCHNVPPPSTTKNKLKIIVKILLLLYRIYTTQSKVMRMEGKDI